MTTTAATSDHQIFNIEGTKQRSKSAAGVESVNNKTAHFGDCAA
jgi:hypothetical protein